MGRHRGKLLTGNGTAARRATNEAGKIPAPARFDQSANRIPRPPERLTLSRPVATVPPRVPSQRSPVRRAALWGLGRPGDAD